MAPVDGAVVHDQVGAGVGGLRRLVAGNDERETVGALRVKSGITSAAAGPGGATSALAGKLPVSAVHVITGGKLLESGLVVERRLGVGAAIPNKQVFRKLELPDLRCPSCGG